MLSSTPHFWRGGVCGERKKPQHSRTHRTQIVTQLFLALWFVFELSHHFHIQTHDSLGYYLANILSPTRVSGLWPLPVPLTVWLTLTRTMSTAPCSQTPGGHLCHWLTSEPWGYMPPVGCCHSDQDLIPGLWPRHAVGSTEQRNLV